MSNNFHAAETGIREVISVTLEILTANGLPPVFQDWVLTKTANNGVVLIGVIDTQEVYRRATKISLTSYHREKLLHDLSTRLGGRTVIPCNSKGVAYAFVMAKGDPPPKLPELVSAPASFVPGDVALGVLRDGREVRVSWDTNMAVAGKTRHGKTSVLHVIAKQAMLEGHNLALCDVGRNTFPMFHGNHPALFTPLCDDPADAEEFINAIVAERDRRSVLFNAMPGYPDTLKAYNAAAEKHGKPKLPRIVAMFDEYMSLIINVGGAKSPLSIAIGTLTTNVLKYGISFVFASHTFNRDVAGFIKTQCVTRLCLPVEDASTANMLVENSRPVQFRRPGRAYLKGEGEMQCYYLSRKSFIEYAEQMRAQAGPAIQTLGLTPTDDDKRLASQLRTQFGGAMNEESLGTLGYSQRQARTLLNEWKSRGWAKKDPARNNACYVELEA